MNRYKVLRFSLEEIANLVAEFTEDGKKKHSRDAVDWFRWLERKLGLGPSRIFRFKRR